MDRGCHRQREETDSASRHVIDAMQTLNAEQKEELLGVGSDVISRDPEE